MIKETFDSASALKPEKATGREAEGSTAAEMAKMPLEEEEAYNAQIATLIGKEDYVDASILKKDREARLAVTQKHRKKPTGGEEDCEGGTKKRGRVKREEKDPVKPK